VIGWGAIALLYYPMLEAPTGKTVGKHLMRVRVASADRGRPPTHAILPHTLTRIIDVLPASVLPGFILCNNGREPRRRLGDRLAGTHLIDT